MQAGVEYENPGESVRKRWERMEFPKIAHQEDLEEFITVLTSLYRQLVKYGCVLPDYAGDEVRLVADLHEKVPKGTQFRLWFYGSEDYKGVTRVRQWIDRAMRYRSML